MTHCIACNMITVESMEDKHPCKIELFLLPNACHRSCELCFSVCAVKANLEYALQKTSGIKRQNHLHIYDTKKHSGVVHTVMRG